MLKTIATCFMSLALIVCASATASQCRGATEKVVYVSAPHDQFTTELTVVHAYEVVMSYELSDFVLVASPELYRQTTDKIFSVVPALPGYVVSLNCKWRDRWAVPWQIGKPDTKRHFAWRCPILKLC